jgi:hypothetical protein
MGHPADELSVFWHVVHLSQCYIDSGCTAQVGAARERSNPLRPAIRVTNNGNHARVRADIAMMDREMRRF